MRKSVFAAVSAGVLLMSVINTHADSAYSVSEGIEYGEVITRTGDNGLTVFAFVLLALSAVAMMVALFVNSNAPRE